MEQGNQQARLSPLSLSRIQNIFLFNGITALLGWNAVLGSLDYFQYIYKDYNVYLYFPIPVFIAYAISALGFYQISKLFSYKKLTIFGIIGVNISMALLILLSIIFKDNFSTGYWLSLSVCAMLGFSNNMCQLSFFAMINYFGMIVVSRFTIGTAASGLLIILVRAVVTGIFGADDQGNIVPIIIYFAIAIIFNFFDLFLNLNLFKTREYQEKIQNINSNPQVQNQKSLMSNNQTDQKKPQLTYSQNMWQSFKIANPYPLLIFLNFVITFMLFPDLTLRKKTSLGGVWTSILMLVMFNLGDLFGKISGDFRGFFNAVSTIYLFFTRFFFFYTIPLMDKSFTQEDILLNNDYFPFVNQLLFAFTNGLVINGCFILSFEKAPNQLKKYAGVLCGILLQFGIMVGTFLAIPFQKLVDPDVTYY